MSADTERLGVKAVLASSGDATIANDVLGSAVARLVAELGTIDLRRVLAEILRVRAHGRDGLAILLVTDCLRAAAADEHPVSTPSDYEQWRTAQPRPDEYASMEFILGHCVVWGRALSLAGPEVDSARRLARRNRPHLAFSCDEAADGIRAWLVESGDQDLTFGAYRAWALQRLADDERLELPVNPRTFISRFGGWDAAVNHAYPRAALARAEARARQEAPVRERMLRDLQRAFPDPNEKKARGRYDIWAKAQKPEPDGWRPRSSFAYLRRFGSWANAVAEANA
ncbi:MAG TPA: hypothetical protein VHV75_10275 [Solirubrobacteraceae bacterium]|nr:hypothetical protein [Solirubrobacteraceae bacterium]